MLTVIVWLAFLLRNEVATVNVAYKKRVFSLCLDKQIEGLVDGEKKTIIGVIDGNCPFQGIKIKLDGNHYINTVVLYGRSILRNGEASGTANIRVSFGVGETTNCGLLEKVPNSLSSEMRANCETVNEKHSQVNIKLENGLLRVSEVEVHSLSSTDDGPMIYRGCFSGFPNSNTYDYKSLTSCRSQCSGNIFMAIKGHKTCFCSNNFAETDHVINDICNITCTNSNYTCGGFQFYSVYLIQVQLPYLLGCEDSVFKSIRSEEGMTVEKCLKQCDQMSFALVKNGSHCACSNKDFNQTAKESCNRLCDGSLCGGPYHWSIYGTCLKVTPPSLPCNRLFHCNKSWNRFGICEGACLHHYSGEYCMERTKAIPSRKNGKLNFIINNEPIIQEVGNDDSMSNGSEYNSDAMPIPLQFGGLTLPGGFTLPGGLTLPGALTLPGGLIPAEDQSNLTEELTQSEGSTTPEDTDGKPATKKFGSIFSAFFFIGISMASLLFLLFLIFIWYLCKE